MLTDIAERQLIDFLLAGDHPVLACLREQLEHVSELTRRYTGVGSFTDFVLSDTAPSLPASHRVVISDVHLELRDVQHGAASLLFVDGGRLGFLEIATYADPMPMPAEIIRMYYLRPTRQGSPALTEAAIRDLRFALRDWYHPVRRSLDT